MAKARMIHRDFFTSADLEDLPAAARLIFAGMIVHADDEGLVRDQPVLFARLYCNGIVLRPCRVRTWLVTLASRGCIASVQREGVSYWQITNFARFQRLNKNRNKNKNKNRRAYALLEGECAPQSSPAAHPEPAPPADPPPPPRTPLVPASSAGVGALGEIPGRAEVFQRLMAPPFCFGATKARQVCERFRTSPETLDAWVAAEALRGTVWLRSNVQHYPHPQDVPEPIQARALTVDEKLDLKYPGTRSGGIA